MIAQTTAHKILRQVGVSTTKKNITKNEKAIRVAAPRYMTDAQAIALNVAGDQGWKARRIVADAKKKACAVCIEKDGDVAWITPDGTVRSEDDIVKGSGLL